VCRAFSVGFSVAASECGEDVRYKKGLLRWPMKTKEKIKNSVFVALGLALIGVFPQRAISREVPIPTSEMRNRGGECRPAKLQSAGRVRQIAFSPDGKNVAYVITGTFSKRRPDNDPVHDIWLDSDMTTGEVFVTRLSGCQTSRVTDGARTGYGYFDVAWSPDSSKLAMLSTRGMITPWIWDSATGIVREISRDPVDFPLSSLAWLSENELVWKTRPPGQLPNMYPEFTTKQAAKFWKRASAGELSADMIESGNGEPGTIEAVDVRAGKALPLGQAQVYISSGRLQSGLQPVELLDGFAYGTQSRPLGHLTGGTAPNELALVSRDRLMKLETPDFVPWSPVYSDGAPTQTFEWTPDLSQVVVIGQAQGGLNVPVEVRRYRRVADRLELVWPGEKDLDPVVSLQQHFWSGMPEVAYEGVPWRRRLKCVTWSSGGELAFMALPARASGAARADWWVESPDGDKIRCLTCNLSVVPESLVSVGEGEFVGVADGHLWEVSTHRNSFQDLTAKLNAVPVSILQASDRDDAAIVITTESSTGHGAVFWDFKVGSPNPIPLPGKGAHVLDYSSAARVVVVESDSKNQSRRWLVSVDSGKSHLVLYSEPTAVKQLEQEEQARLAVESKTLDYRGLRGEPLKAWLTWPLEVAAGKEALPMVVYGYPGRVRAAESSASANGPSYIEISDDWVSALLQNGYAVLEPSMPDGSAGARNDPLFNLTDGVLPAIDAAVATGLVDGNHVGFMGHSYGGFAAFGLATQTDRFKAIVAMNGMADFLSIYGSFGGPGRYGGPPSSPAAFGMSWDETGQAMLGAPPWVDLERYVRNSPITYVDRVSAPMLIISGDLDFVPMQQAEEFYTALFRLNKRCRFIRYWGEGHDVESPANRRDEADQIVKWFNEFLKTQKIK